MTKPFLLLSTRPEDDAVVGERAAILAKAGLAEAELVQHRVERFPLPELDLSDFAGVFLGGGPIVTAIAFVAAGIGIAVMPRLCTTDLPDGVHAVDVVNPTPTRSIHVLVRRAVESSPAVQLVVGGLLAQARAASVPPPHRGARRAVG